MRKPVNTTLRVFFDPEYVLEFRYRMNSLADSLGCCQAYLLIFQLWLLGNVLFL